MLTSVVSTRQQEITDIASCLTFSFSLIRTLECNFCLHVYAEPAPWRVLSNICLLGTRHCARHCGDCNDYDYQDESDMLKRLLKGIEARGGGACPQ